MKLQQLVILVSFVALQPAWASDACSTRAIFTEADVQVSDGSHFGTETWFHSAEASAIRHIQEENQIVAVEGPVAWISRGEKSRPGDDQLASFALGHQFHAMLLHFDDIVSNVADQTAINFDGGLYPGKSGDFKYGGEIFLIQDTKAANPLGLVFKLPDQPHMEIKFSKWQSQEGISLPFHIRIDDGSRVFDYEYTRVDLAEKPYNWFADSIDAPDIDELGIYRLHRRLLAAHCAADADAIADLTASEIIVSSRGNLQESSREETRSRFERVFQAVDYNHYHDLQTPVVEVSESGDIGWIGVNVQAVGNEITSSKPFDMRWSWVMLTRKIDGVWYNAGNASNHSPLGAEE